MLVTSSQENTAAVDASGIDSASSDIWSKCIAHLQLNIEPHVFSAYIAPLEPIEFDENSRTLTVAAPSMFLAGYVERYLRDSIGIACGAVLNTDPYQVTVSVSERSKAKSAEAARSPQSSYVVVKKVKLPTEQEKKISQPVEKLSIGHQLNPRYTFASYVVGSSNQFCHAAAMRVAENPGQSYNPLFIYGGVGLGKTHLLHAIGNAVLAKDPQARVVYLSSETFTNELIGALRNAKMDEFKRKMRSIEVLLIDDIQFMRGKERTQEEFFHTFNAIYEAKHQIIISSDKPPADIPGLEERLQTRFSWGLTADIQAPDFETRVAILNRKASLDGVNIPSEISHLIAERVSSNVRELEGALTKITAMHSLQNVPISEELVQRALKPFFQQRSTQISVDDIKRVVAARFGIKISDMVSKRRTKNLALPRHIAMYLCRKHTTASYPEIGEQFGGRDHSSVIHAANVIATKVKVGSEIVPAIEDIERELFV